MGRAVIEHRPKLEEVLVTDGDRLAQEMWAYALPMLRTAIEELKQRMQSPDNVFTLEETAWADLHEKLEKVSRAYQETEAAMIGRLKLWHDVLSAPGDPQLTSGPKSFFEVELIGWFVETVRRLEEQGRSVAEAIRRSIAGVNEAIIYRNLAAVRDWLPIARLRQSVATFARDATKASPATLRELVGPNVISAGGCSGRFALTC